MRKTRNLLRAFTLIELLLVISISGFLASFVLVGYQRAQERGRAVTIVQDFKTIENSLRLLRTSEDRDTWWGEAYWPGGHKISQITNLPEFMPVTPEPPMTDSYYEYDNDGDTIVEGDCGCCKGVNIGLRNCGTQCQKHFNLVDDIVDHRDGACHGRVRTDAGFTYIYFNIASNENL